MFEKIAEELGMGGQSVGRDTLLTLAPVYLSTVPKIARECRIFALEQLLLQLEEQGVFSMQVDGLLCLFLEYGILDEKIGETLGFSDEFGQFKLSLEQWLSYLNMHDQIEQGIVWICVDWSREYLSESVWWRRFFRQMGRYKSNFLFILQTAEKDAAVLQEWIGGEYFCRRLSNRQMEASDYVEVFKRGLVKADLYLDEEGEKKLIELLDHYLDIIDGQMLMRWQQELVWEYFLSEDILERKNPIFPASCITEASFKSCMPSRRGLSKIGFEMANLTEK